MKNIEIADKQFELFMEAETISKRIRLLGLQINMDYEDSCPIFIGVLNGSFMFMADLMKEIEISCETEFIRVASYHGSKSSGSVKEIMGFPESLNGRDIVIVEDIVDTGLTLSYILEKIKLLNPKSVKICTLLFKPAALKAPLKALEYVGFEIPNEFVVGYGLDYNGLGRNLKNIYKNVEG